MPHILARSRAKKLCLGLLLMLTSYGAPQCGSGNVAAQEQAPTPGAEQSIPENQNEPASQQAAVPAPSDRLIQHNPSFLVHLKVDREDRRYLEGESMSVSIISEEDAYAYVLYKQVDGNVYQIFPNSVQQDNHIAAKEEVKIPGTDDLFRWEVSAPFGKECLTVIATKEPLDGLNDVALREKCFNPIPSSSLHRASEVLKSENPTERIEWAEDRVEVVTYAQDGPQPERHGKRFGVFFGVSKYEFDKAVAEATEGRWSPNLPTCASDAKAVALLMYRLGKLDDLEVYCDEQATRRQMEQAITSWLPSVSRPGDTVFIFFSGHGGQLPDDNGDEKDGHDEWLLPHDYVDAAVLLGLLKLQKESRLDPALEARLSKWLAIAQRVGAEKAGETLARETGVTDDLFGHWLQRLSGRQVVVIMDACHSGGLANDEKSFDAPGSGGFDFLNGEVARLKDIGQPESSLLAACHFNESAQSLRATDEMLEEIRATVLPNNSPKGTVDEWVDGLEVSVLSYYIVEGLLAGERPMLLPTMHTHCSDGMRRYFNEVNDLRRSGGLQPVTPHEPVLINYSSRPVLVKP